MRKITLVVVRNGMKLSKPCEKCENVIKELGIGKIYYSCDGKIMRLTF